MSNTQREVSQDELYLLAQQFSKQVRADIIQLKGVKAFLTMVNDTIIQKPWQKGICLSHDYCDANMSMDAAFAVVFGKGCLDFRTAEDEDGCSEVEDWALEAWNQAWGIAQRNGFFII